MKKKIENMTLKEIRQYKEDFEYKIKHAIIDVLKEYAEIKEVDIRLNGNILKILNSNKDNIMVISKIGEEI